MFIDAAQKAMYKSPHFNGQYYVCPSINESILAGLKVGSYQIPNDDFHPLGIPEDVSNFSEHFSESPLD